MSKKLLAAAVALTALALPATAWSFKLQKPEMTNKGTFTFGGGLNIASLTITDTPEGGDGADTDSTAIGIAPNIGYFVIDSLEIGVLLDYHSASSKPEGGDEVESSGFGVGLYGAYYFNFLEGNALYPYIGASFRYLSDTLGEDLESSGTDIRPGIGLMMAIGSRTGGWMKLGVDYQLKSTTATFDGDDVGTQDTSGVVVGLGFGLYLQ